jgi:hypothetical protein
MRPTNEIYLDAGRLRSLNISVDSVAAYLKSAVPFAAVYSQDQVRAAQRDLR